MQSYMQGSRENATLFFTHLENNMQYASPDKLAQSMGWVIMQSWSLQRVKVL